MLSAAKACQEKGAKSIYAVVTHGLFVGEAIGKILESPIEMLFVSNSIPWETKLADRHKIISVSVASLLAQAIQCILESKSISFLTKIDES